MRSIAKKYNTQYKKRVLERDAYLPRLSPKGTMECGRCGAFYYQGRWSLNLPKGLARPVHPHPIYCPACRKMREHYPGGELHLLCVGPRDRNEIVKILYNEEERARQKNPLERIIQFQVRNGDWRVETTTEKLAQRLGRSLKKARGGKLVYKWGHNNKFVRVMWEQKAT